MDSYRKYSADVPKFLHNRPRKLVKHCTQRLYYEDVISLHSDNVFHVHSTDSGQSYNVSLTVPSCTCPDFKMNKWPCKHILFVLKKDNDYDWECLPDHYRNLPCFVIDSSVLIKTELKETARVNNNIKQNISTCHETSIPECKPLHTTIGMLKELMDFVYCIDNPTTMSLVQKRYIC